MVRRNNVFIFNEPFVAQDDIKSIGKLLKNLSLNLIKLFLWSISLGLSAPEPNVNIIKYKPMFMHVHKCSQCNPR